MRTSEAMVLRACHMRRTPTDFKKPSTTVACEVATPLCPFDCVGEGISSRVYKWCNLWCLQVEAKSERGEGFPSRGFHPVGCKIDEKRKRKTDKKVVKKSQLFFFW